MADVNGQLIGKKAKIEILKDGRRLIYTADIVEVSNGLITFFDRDNTLFSFPTSAVREIEVLK
jgi:hypothetical protein